MFNNYKGIVCAPPSIASPNYSQGWIPTLLNAIPLPDGSTHPAPIPGATGWRGGCAVCWVGGVEHSCCAGGVPPWLLKYNVDEISYCKEFAQVRC